MDVSSMIGNPDNRFSSSYSELDEFREKAYKGVKIDANKYSVQEIIKQKKLYQYFNRIEFLD